MKATRQWQGAAVAVLLAGAMSATAQAPSSAAGGAGQAPAGSGSTWEDARGEVFGYGGYYRAVEGVNAVTGGGGVGYLAHRRLRVFGEFLFAHGNDASTSLFIIGNRLVGGIGGVQVLFPGQGSETTPFLTVGGVLGRASNTTFDLSDSSHGLTVGGGVDRRVSGKWGIRPEFRVFFPGPEYRATFGVFYRF